LIGRESGRAEFANDKTAAILTNKTMESKKAGPRQKRGWKTTMRKICSVGEAAPLVPAQNQHAANTPSADDPITLAEACKLFPKARLTVSTLRAEHKRGRLEIFRLGRRDYTTESDMRAMVQSSKEKSRRRVSIPTTANADTAKAAALNGIATLRRRISENRGDGGRKLA
jgi:hypothetical protein